MAGYVNFLSRPKRHHSILLLIKFFSQLATIHKSMACELCFQETGNDGPSIEEHKIMRHYHCSGSRNCRIYWDATKAQWIPGMVDFYFSSRKKIPEQLLQIQIALQDNSHYQDHIYFLKASKINSNKIISIRYNIETGRLMFYFLQAADFPQTYYPKNCNYQQSNL